MHIEDILSMPDKCEIFCTSLALTDEPDRWEYPFFAAWDTAFHCIPLAVVDPAFAKKQLDLLTREWYMKPDGQIPAYEWNFSDVNPPVHAWYVMILRLELYINFFEQGNFPSIQDRAETSRTRRSGILRAGLPKVIAQFHLVREFLFAVIGRC